MTTTIKHKQEILNTIKELHQQKGWNAVYAYLRYANIKHQRIVTEFGLENKDTFKRYQGWISFTPENAYRAHLYARQVTQKGTGWRYNIVRGQEIILL